MTKTRLFLVCILVCNNIPLLQAFTSTCHINRCNSNASANARLQTLLQSTVTERQTQVGYVVGDTKGAALMIEDIAVSRGGNQLLSDINWSVQRYERWGIVGPNVSIRVRMFAVLLPTYLYFERILRI